MSKKIIFIVENDEEVLDVLFIILSKKYEVHLFASPPDNFLSIVDIKKPDIVIMDWLIPNVHTEDLIVPVKNIKTDCKVLIISAHQSVYQAFKEETVDAILLKPFGTSELNEVLFKLLESDEINKN